MSMLQPVVRAIAVVSAFAAMIGHGEPARAQVNCDDPRIVEKLPKPPNGCHSERITAAGNQRPTLGWAQRSAEDSWRDLVLTKFGERFRTFANSACARQECVPAAIMGMYRCTYSGFPCSARFSVGGTIELSANEIEEMQRLLRRKGFKVSVDGKFGPKTQAALEGWQKSTKVTVDGQPTRANLERLRAS